MSGAIRLAAYRHERDNTPRAVNGTWAELAILLANDNPTLCTTTTCGHGDYQQPGKAGDCKFKYGKAWSPVEIEGTRANQNVRTITAAVFDLDHVADDSWRDHIAGYRAMVHGTHGHRACHPRLRLVVALSRPVLADDWPRVWPALVNRFAPGADKQCKDLARLYFLPTRPSDAPHYFEQFEGEPVDVDAILELVEKPVLRSVASSHLGSPSARGSMSSEHVEKRARAYLAKIPGGVAGENGSGPTYNAALALVRGFRLSPAAALAILESDYNPRCDPPWSTKELEHKVASAASSSKAPPDGFLLEKPEPTYQNGHARNAQPPPEPGTFADDLVIALADVQSALGAAAKSDREPLFFDAADLFTRDYPATQWLLTGLVTRGGTAIMGGEPKHGKTWVALEAAVAIATGTPVFGEFFAQRGNVAYFLAEDLAVQVRNRVGGLLASRNLGPEAVRGRLHVQPRGKFLDLTIDADLAWIVASCRRIGKLDLLVLDPLRDLHSGEEDKSDSMRDVMRRLRLLGELLGCTVLVLHHTGKKSVDTKGRKPGQRLRGSGAVHGSIDSGIYLDGPGHDGAGRFELNVEVEVKGARSAGAFKVVLAVEDDAEGCAVRASWSVSRPEPKPVAGRAAGNADADVMFGFVRDLAIRGEHLSKTALREHDECPLADKRARAGLEHLLEAERLVRIGAAIHLPPPPVEVER